MNDERNTDDDANPQTSVQKDANSGKYVWSPISREELFELLSKEIAELTPEQHSAFEKLRVELGVAYLPRGKCAELEQVFVVAEYRDSVLYFDDAEWGFEWSEVDGDRRILRPTANQDTLGWALEKFIRYFDRNE